MRLLRLMLALLPFATSALAEVTRFELQGPASVIFGGQEFGAAGRYERIIGRASIALDPADPRNAAIVDLVRAPRNAAGRVEATADVTILRPLDPARGNGTLLVEVPNRGREIIGQLFHDAPAANTLSGATNAGNGHLLRQGYTLAWIGWQADIPPGQGFRLAAPVLPGVTGASREEFLFDHARSPVVVPLTYPAATREGAVLTVRGRTEAPRQQPADLGFRWLDDRRIEITRPAGFDAGALYEVTYTATDPAVQGVAFAAVRDIALHLRADPAARLSRAILTGVSQSGRFVRDYLYLGFNQGPEGRAVFEAMLPHIAGTRRTFTNARFAQPGRNPTPHADQLYPADQFPFTYETTTDHLTGVRDGLLLRCRASNTCPRIMQTDSEYEFWGARASLLVTDTRGAPVALPENVRAYMMAGHPHYQSAQSLAETIDRCLLPVNPLQAGAPMRALLAALEAWMRDGTPPPDSRFPNLVEGSLVAPEGLYAGLGILRYRGEIGPALLGDYAPMPPVVRGRYPVLAPRVDADGNALAGVRLPVLSVPKATYTGWNPRAPGFAPGALCYNTGAAVGFAATPAARAADDPRPSLAERYPTAEAYVAAVRRAAAELVALRLLLAEDAAAMGTAAAADTLARLPK